MAFPATPVLESGAGSVNAGPPSGIWSAPWDGAPGKWKLDGAGHITGTLTGSNFNAAYITVAVARPVEVYLTFTGRATGEELDLELFQGTLSAPNGYALSIHATNTWTLNKVTGGSFSSLAEGSGVVDGDTIGLRLSASGVLTPFRNGSALTTVTDTTYTGSFNIGGEFESSAATLQITNFGGGAVPATTSVAAVRSLLGVGA